MEKKIRLENFSKDILDKIRVGDALKSYCWCGDYMLVKAVTRNFFLAAGIPSNGEYCNIPIYVICDKRKSTIFIKNLKELVQLDYNLYDLNKLNKTFLGRYGEFDNFTQEDMYFLLIGLENGNEPEGYSEKICSLYWTHTQYTVGAEIIEY